jgi:hypothetical protein
MSRIDPASPALTQKLLPALRMMVRFPTRTTNVVSFESGCELSELAAWIKAHGRPRDSLLRVLEQQGLDPEGKARDDGKSTLDTGKLAKALAPAAPRATDSARKPVALAGDSQPAATAAPTANLGQWLALQQAKVMGQVQCFQVEVTPAVASRWLTFNTGNRKPSRSKIRRFAAAMAAGKWALNGETVKFSITGRLLDGQSRLLAIVAAKTTVVLEVRAGLPDIAQQSMDAGELRRGSHTLEMLGESNPGVLSSALKWCWLLDKGWFVKRPFGEPEVMENSEVAPTLALHAGLKASVGWSVGPGHRCDKLLPRSEAALWHYWLGRAANKLERDEFFEALVEGIGLTKASPVWHLRERLLEMRSSTKDTRKQRTIRGALFIKAWNLFTADVPCIELKWRSEGDKPERFPEIAGAGAKGGAA